MSGIFISYRREESAPYAGRLRDRLVQEFGHDQVFMDIDTIDLGVDFVKAIEQAVSDVDVLVCVMGPKWHSITDEGGMRRLENPGDFVRLEIAHALKRDIRVVPVLVRGALMPSADQLPADIAKLATRNALPLDDARFHADVDRLVESIRRLMPDSSLRPRLPSPTIRGKVGLRKSWLVVAGVLLLAAGGVWYSWDRHQERVPVEPQRKALSALVVPGSGHSFVEKDGHLVSTTNGSPLCPTPPGWHTGCYSIEVQYRQNWRNTPDGYIANGKKVKTFNNRSERTFEILGTKHAFYVDDGHLFYYPAATILCPWPKAGAGKCYKIELQYEDNWRNTPQGFIADGHAYNAIEVMRDIRQGLF